MKNTCIVCESGWILIGKKEANEAVTVLSDALVVRRWDNGRGIGGIAKEEYKGEYILDYIGTVEINNNKILFQIPCEW